VTRVIGSKPIIRIGGAVFKLLSEASFACSFNISWLAAMASRQGDGVRAKCRSNERFAYPGLQATFTADRCYWGKGYGVRARCLRYSCLGLGERQTSGASDALFLEVRNIIPYKTCFGDCIG